MKRIILSRNEVLWSATFPDNPDMTELFGTDTVPTPYRAVVPSHVVLQNIRDLNPTADVQLKE
jgi:hypothetical protein